MTRLWIDTETFSEVPITHGTHAYAERAEIMLCAWAIGDGPVSVWDCVPEPMPDQLRDALCDDQVLIYAHNSHFDRTVMRHAGSVIERAAAKNLPRWRDTMVKALCHGLPGSLGDLCSILEVPTDEHKDKAGRQLIQLFCKPRPTGSKIHRADRKSHPAEWARFVEYAALDITAMRAIDRKLPEWNYRNAELALWHRDQAINDRGVAVDVELATAAVATVSAEQKTLARRTQQLTSGDVQAATQRDALLGHILVEYGVDLPDMQAATIERRAADPDLPPELRELLAIRLQASTSSTAKYNALLRGVSGDSRLRGTLQYSGAQRTRRWAGRLFQPQNLPRPVLKQPEIDLGIQALKTGCADLVTDNVMQLTSNAIRGCLVAPAGRKLVVSDLSNIEGRVAAWLAGEDWKLQAFREYDEGSGPDLYRLAYARAFAIEPDDVEKDQRQVGKVMELMLQYEGGVGAFLTGAATYGVGLAEHPDLGARGGHRVPGVEPSEAPQHLRPGRPHVHRLRCAEAHVAREARVPGAAVEGARRHRRARGRVARPDLQVRHVQGATRRQLAAHPPALGQLPLLPLAFAEGRDAALHGRQPVHPQVVAVEHVWREAVRERLSVARPRRDGAQHARNRGRWLRHRADRARRGDHRGA